MQCGVYLKKCISVVHSSLRTFHATLTHNHFSLLSQYKFKILYSAISGYAMAEAWILFQTSSSGICGQQSGIGTGLPPSTGLFEMIVGVLTTCHTQYT
jgi:hypothetical protein